MSNKSMAFMLQGDARSSELEIDIYSLVGDGGYWSDWVSARQVRNVLRENKLASSIKLSVHSDGGDVFDGFAIYHLLNQHPARVTAEVVGMAASVAGVIVMAADEITIAPGGWMMIHNAWGGAQGESDDLRNWADQLDKMTEQAVEIYATRTGLSADKIRKMMAAETWLTADEALKLGFVDKVETIKAKAMAQATMSARGGFAMMAARDFVNVPAALREQLEHADGSLSRRDTDAEEKTMGDENKAMLATLGVATVAEAAGRLALLTRIEAATGKAGDEAHGILMAALASHAELPKAKTRIAELEKSTQDASLEAMIAKGKAEHKLTPALEKTVRDQYAAGEITLKGAEAWLANLTPIAALAGDKKAPAPPPAGGPAPTWDGKTYGQLSYAERAALKTQHPELYDEMRKNNQPGAVAR